MPYKDLREFLERLEREGQLLRAEDLPEPNLSPAASAAERISTGAAIYFENILRSP